jgi:hypothetical protein
MCGPTQLMFGNDIHQNYQIVNINVLVGKVKNIVGNTIKSFGIKNVSPFISKVLQDLTDILPK